MEFRQIRYFLAACDHMNFTRAAENCAVSQPALTVAIRKLEEELGGPLFVRQAGGISLTPLGQVMRTHLARVEETRQAAHGAAAEALSEEMEHIQLGLMCTIGPKLISGAFAEWRQRAPRTELVLHDVWSMRATELLLSGAIDCALMASRTPLPDRFEARSLMSEEFELAAATNHALLVKAELMASDLASTHYLDRLRCEFRDTVISTLGEQDVTLDVTIKSEREDWLQSLVARGDGVTMLPRNSIVVEGVATRPVEGLRFNRDIQIVTVRGRPQRKVVADFVEFMTAFEWPEAA
ncbi:MAG: LysR family transcriptional regulator [Pseudomonadota bacterium]